MKQKIEVIQAYINAYNVFNISEMLKNLHTDVVFENYASEILTCRIQGIQEFEIQAKKAATLFKSREQQITEITTNENEIVVAIEYHGILALDMSEDLKKGEEIILEGKSIFLFRDQKIIKIVDIS